MGTLNYLCNSFANLKLFPSKMVFTCKKKKKAQLSPYLGCHTPGGPPLEKAGYPQPSLIFLHFIFITVKSIATSS